MNNEKLENLLNLALNATPEEREKSLELNVGYDTASRSWEVIVKAFCLFKHILDIRCFRSCFHRSRSIRY